MTYSSAGRRSLYATSAKESIVIAIEVIHPDLAVPLRFVNDNQDLFIGDDRYFATRFDVTLPDNKDQQVPRARLSVDNVGRELTQWLEQSNGGKGAKCRLLQVLRSQTDDYDAEDYFAQDYVYGENPIIEFDITLDLTGLSINNLVVDGELGFRDTLNQSAVAVRYTPQTAPGLW